jgi:hypothetical protein
METYSLARAYLPENLECIVNGRLNCGWRLFGGPFRDSDDMICQAMTRENRPHDERSDLKGT